MTHSLHKSVFLNQGDIYFGSAPRHIQTLLGSCVAITIWHPHKHIGGMCHILLPSRSHRSSVSLDAKYADDAVRIFANELKSRNIHAHSCHVKLFGGGNMFTTSISSMEIGRLNIEASRHALHQQGFIIMDEHVGGKDRRHLSLDLSNGHVKLRVGNAHTVLR